MSEYFAVVTRGENPVLEVMDALQDILEFHQLCNVLYPNDESNKKFIHLIKEHKPKGLLIHDFEIASIALAHNVLKIATINKKDFVRIKEIEVLPV